MVNIMKAPLLIYSLFCVLLPSLVLISIPQEKLSSDSTHNQELSINNELNSQDNH